MRTLFFTLPDALPPWINQNLLSAVTSKFTVPIVHAGRRVPATETSVPVTHAVWIVLVRAQLPEIFTARVQPRRVYLVPTAEAFIASTVVVVVDVLSTTQRCQQQHQYKYRYTFHLFASFFGSLSFLPQISARSCMIINLRLRVNLVKLIKSIDIRLRTGE